MSPEIFTMFGGFLLSMVVFTMLGRVVCLNTAGDRAIMSTGLFYMLTGAGLWYLTYLTALVFDFYMISPIWWAYVLCAIALFLVLFKERKKQKVGEHFFTQIFAAMAFVAPTLFLLLNDTPQIETEFNGVVRQLQYIMFKGHLPPVGEGTQALLGMFNQMPAYLAVLLPSNLIPMHYSPAVFALFNVFLLVLVSEMMTRASNINVRWSNLPLVAVGGVIGVTLLNPFLRLENISSAQLDLLYAVGLFVALVPFMREKEAPKGLSAIAPAIILALVTGLHPMGLVGAGVVVLVFFVRLVTDKAKFDLETIFALFVYIVLPLFTWLLWQNETYDAALSGYNNAVVRWGFISNLSHYILWDWLSAFLVILVVGVAVAQLFDADVHENINRYMWLLAPAFFIFVYIALGVLLKQNISLGHLQFIVLLPIWRWAVWWYEGSSAQKIAYQHPWFLGIGFALVFVVVQSIVKQDLKDDYDDAMMHTFNVGRVLATEYMPNNENVAVLGAIGREHYTVSLLRYALVSKAGNVFPASYEIKEAASDPDILHRKLRRKNVNYIWVHSPTINERDLFSINFDSQFSYLLSVEESGYKTLRKFPHPTYNAQILSQACLYEKCRLGHYIK